jgi:glycyl-tRNA synthetase
VTVDGQSVEDGTVTVRDRDTLQQVRVHMTGAAAYLREALAAARGDR